MSSVGLRYANCGVRDMLARVVFPLFFLFLSPSVAIGQQVTASGDQQDPCATKTSHDPICEREREREEAEKPTKSSFFDHVHLDLFGVPPQIATPSMVGVVGGHITIAEIGRVHFFGPPGVLLILRSTADRRSRSWTPSTAFTWGISIRVTEFRMRGSIRRAVMFLNLTKVWTWGGLQQGTDFVGLSFAWKKNPPSPPP
jgi:hypothetical protein